MNLSTIPVSRWPADWRERWNERAAMREMDGRQTRAAAEEGARLEVLEQWQRAEAKAAADAEELAALEEMTRH